jgi:CRP-like cAMP-binding protein
MIDRRRLRPFSPFNALSGQALEQVATECLLRQAAPGQVLFRRGDCDPEALFLLEGEVELRADGADAAPLLVRAGSETAQHRLSRLKPRRYTGTAHGRVSLACIDEERLDQILALDQTAAYEVTELGGEDPEWMFRMMRQPAFQKIPPANLAALFAALEKMEVKDGQVILRQGEAGDYYYLIVSGQARVSRLGPAGDPETLAVLGPGDGFGEEALLSGLPRNADVTMLGDGRLMRLKGSDFEAILTPPLVRWVDPAEALALRIAGAQLVDIRLADEYAAGSLPGSLNLPLCHLRHLSEGLDRQRKYIVFCHNDRRSRAAAFLMSQRGFDTYVMRGGLAALGRS